MPKTGENLVHLYWDKALLLILAAVGIWVFMTRVISSPIESKGARRSNFSPRLLAEELDKNVGKLEQALQRPARLEDQPPNYVEPIETYLDEIPPDLPRNAITGAMPGTKTLRIRSIEIVTPKVLAPLNIQARASLGQVSSKLRNQPQKEINWVTVAAEFPFLKQYMAFAGISPRVDPSKRLEEKDRFFRFARLELERQELQADKGWSKSEPINPYETYKRLLPQTVEALSSFYKLSHRLEGSDNAQILRDWLARPGFQEFIVRPEFLELYGFEQWYWPDTPPETTAGQSRWLALAGLVPRDSAPKYRLVSGTTIRKGLSRRPRTVGPSTTPLMAPPRMPSGAAYGSGSPYAREAPLIYGMAGAEMPSDPSPRRPTRTRRGPTGRKNLPRTYNPDDPNTPESIKIWAHDSSVEPGKIYRYRMRVLLFNPLCGSQRAESTKVRQESWLSGEWSDWSEPIQAWQRRYFFFTGISRYGAVPRARLLVYAFEKGYWYNQTFSSEKGQSIGSLRDVPALVAVGRSAASRDTGRDTDGRTPLRAPVRRPKIEIDFSTGWTVVDFTPDIKFDPRKGQPDQSGSETADELTIRKDNGGRMAKRYSIQDKKSPQKQHLDEIMARQKEALNETAGPRGAVRPGRRPPEKRPSLRDIIPDRRPPKY